MASGEGFHTASAPADEWLSSARAAMNVVATSLSQAPFAHAIDEIQTYRGELESLEALLVAQRSEAGFSDTSTEAIMKRSGRVSKGEARKRTKRSETIKKNPKLAKKLSKGDLSAEKLDLLSEADDKTDGAAAHDSTLIEKLENANPDEGRSIIRDFIDDHTSQDERDSRYAKQRRRRKVWKEKRRNGMSRLVAEGDDESIDEMIGALRQNSDVLYRDDGGRDVANKDHPRSHDQRMFDAAHKLLTQDPDVEPSPEQSSADQPATTRSRGKAPNRPSTRPAMVFTANITDISDDPALLAQWKAELIGSGIVPTPIRDYFACISDLSLLLVDQDGDPLWKGRGVRNATPGQWLALIVRDKGCVQCGAHHSRCEAHHQTPWTAPAKGESNIDELVMLCVDCHHRLHELNHTIYRNKSSGKWETRPATWAETPANGPPKRRPPRSRGSGPPDNGQRTKPDRASVTAKPSAQQAPESRPKDWAQLNLIDDAG